MSRKGFRILVIMLAVAVSPLAVTPSMADDEATPVKIAVEPSSQKVLVGGQVEVNLVLQNARNKVAKAPKMMDVIVEFTSPSGQRNQTKVVFKPQETSATITLPVEQSGVFSIHAKQPELLNDDAFIFGVNPKPRSMRPSERRAATIARTQSVTASRRTSPSRHRWIYGSYQPLARRAWPSPRCLPPPPKVGSSCSTGRPARSWPTGSTRDPSMPISKAPTAGRQAT
jgi:hypothetical protein